MDLLVPGVGVVLLLVVVWLVWTYNRFVSLRNEARQAWSGMEIQLKRRADLVPNLAEVTRAYAAHEAGTFEATTAARAATMSAGTPLEMAAADGMMQGALTGLLGLAEAYPDLKASENFVLLGQQLMETEDKVASARQYYNGVVRRYNTVIQQLPASLVAGAFSFAPLEFYRPEDDSHQQPVRVALTSALATAPTGAGT